ncbi:MAG: hypothetical protein KL863_05665 [Rhizobium sp.]|nr:hypothetical protein [Rhizobium sp.]
MFFNPDEFSEGVQPLSRQEMNQLGLQPMTIRDLLFALDPLPGFAAHDGIYSDLTEI